MRGESSVCCPRGFALQDRSGCAFPPAPAVADQACESTAQQGERTRLRSSDGTEQTMILDLTIPGNSGREIQSVGTCALGAVPKGKAPETEVDERHAVAAIYGSDLGSGCRIERIDGAVAEVSN